MMESTSMIGLVESNRKDLKSQALGSHVQLSTLYVPADF